MPFIIGNETFEKLGAIGTLANLLVYLTQVFNMKSITAANFLNVFNGTSNFATLAGAVLSDTFFGRYTTLGFCSILSFLGLFVIALTHAIPTLHPPTCDKNAATCEGATGGQIGFLLVGFGLMVVGAGGVRPCSMPFGADQFDPGTESGKRGANSFFNWFVATLTFAQMVSLTGVVYVQTEVSWTAGLMIPAGLMLIAVALFFLGTRLYVKVKPQGSPLVDVCRVVAAAAKKRRLKLPEQPGVSLFNHVDPLSINSRLPHTDQFRCLDKAAIRTEADSLNTDGSPADGWGLCSMQQVEEAKCVMRVIPIWVSAFMFTLVGNQLTTYHVFQALQSDRRLTHRFDVPAASYGIFTMLTISLWLPIYDLLLVPFLRRLTGKEGGITLLQRLGIGIFFSIVSMLISALVEGRRRSTALAGHTVGIVSRGGTVSSMSAFWLVPQLMIMGLAEGFGNVAQVEFYYKQFPENMRSMGGSLFFLGMAVASYLSSFLISTVHRLTKGAGTESWLADDLNKGKLDYYYLLVGGLGVLNLVYFVVVSRWYTYKGTGDVKVNVEMNGTDKHARV